MKKLERKEKIVNAVDKATTVIAIIETPFCLPITALTTKFVCKKMKKKIEQEKQK